MMDLQAAIGPHQLRRVSRYWERRRAIWDRYGEALKALPLHLPADPEPGTRHAYHLYSVLIDEERAGLSRDDFLGALTACNIGAGVHYLSIPEHPYYIREFGWKAEDFPVTAYVGRRTVSLPLSPKLKDDDVEDVVAALTMILRDTPRWARSAKASNQERKD